MNAAPSIDRGRIVVVSPHLDDAALSLGATIARAARSGADVTIATVFAGDPAGDAAAGAWDRLCGFASAGEAARARRLEDERACGILGATPLWLPFADEEYVRVEERSEDDVRTALAPVLAHADLVLVPGAPLVNDDHAWLARAVLAQRPDAGLFVEQPYASDVAIGRGRSLRPLLAAARIAATTRLGRVASAEPAEPIAELAPDHGHWVAVRPTRAERALKERAIRAYASQVGALGGQVLLRIRLHEAVAGGERLFLPHRP